MYIQKLYRNMTINDAARRALLDEPSATFLQAEVQRNLFYDDTEVFVTMEIKYAPGKK
jgi:hypothetical protein